MHCPNLPPCLAVSSCSMCPVGSYSIGGTLNPCTMCNFGFTSPAGSSDSSFCYATDQCPPGTVVPEGLVGSSPADCVCKPGFGGSECRRAKAVLAITFRRSLQLDQALSGNSWSPSMLRVHTCIYVKTRGGPPRTCQLLRHLLRHSNCQQTNGLPLLMFGFH